MFSPLTTTLVLFFGAAVMGVALGGAVHICRKDDANQAEREWDAAAAETTP